mmetsp:Transcript_113088/g.314784  ORF Transcript_113088/g.314784 Transcript_113088/m.314784 type:complete len:282 (+) Transcript_113088:1050-1895(+)
MHPRAEALDVTSEKRDGIVGLSALLLLRLQQRKQTSHFTFKMPERLADVLQLRCLHHRNGITAVLTHSAVLAPTVQHAARGAARLSARLRDGLCNDAPLELLSECAPKRLRPLAATRVLLVDHNFPLRPQPVNLFAHVAPDMRHYLGQGAAGVLRLLAARLLNHGAPFKAEAIELFADMVLHLLHGAQWSAPGILQACADLCTLLCQLHRAFCRLLGHVQRVGLLLEEHRALRREALVDQRERSLPVAAARGLEALQPLLPAAHTLFQALGLPPQPVQFHL